MVGILIRINQFDPDPYEIEKQDPDAEPDRYQSESRIQIRIKRVWIRNTGGNSAASGIRHITYLNGRDPDPYQTV
jgi:hypothetical protein